MEQKSVIIITGGASGIGKYLAQSLASQGYCLVVTDIQEDSLQILAKEESWTEEQVITARLDVTSPESWQEVIDQTLQKWHRIDVLMNVAGICVPGFIHETPFELIDRHIDINLKGVIYGSKLVAPVMVKQQQGQIINIASLAGVAPVKGMNLYSASKFGVRGFSLAIAHELKTYGVVVSVVCPDAVDTPMLTNLVGYKEAALTFSGGRVLTVEDIGQVILKKALAKKKIEVLYPATRGLYAKLGSFFTGLGGKLTNTLSKKGARKQAKLQGHK
ncbi:hypothetical protein BKI52_26005 [marine bacterium AO1-C]|nr:hypothetical protein BKI52_26005 [marine bacterium AO1-C]